MTALFYEKNQIFKVVFTAGAENAEAFYFSLPLSGLQMKGPNHFVVLFVIPSNF